MNTKTNREKLAKARDLLKEVALDFKGWGEAGSLYNTADRIQEQLDIFEASSK